MKESERDVGLCHTGMETTQQTAHWAFGKYVDFPSGQLQDIKEGVTQT